MKRFVQPNMYRLLRNGSRDEYHLADRAEEIAWELHKVLSVFEPCGDDDNRSIWLEVPRGKITDWMTYDDAMMVMSVLLITRSSQRPDIGHI